MSVSDATTAPRQQQDPPANQVPTVASAIGDATIVSETVRWQGYPVVNKPGEYQAGGEASISVKAVYQLADGSEVSSAAVSLTCTVAE